MGRPIAIFLFINVMILLNFSYACISFGSSSENTPEKSKAEKAIFVESQIDNDTERREKSFTTNLFIQIPEKNEFLEKLINNSKKEKIMKEVIQTSEKIENKQDLDNLLAANVSDEAFRLNNRFIMVKILKLNYEQATLLPIFFRVEVLFEI